MLLKKVNAESGDDDERTLFVTTFSNYLYILHYNSCVSRDVLKYSKPVNKTSFGLTHYTGHHRESQLF